MIMPRLLTIALVLLAAAPAVAEMLDIAPVWAGHPVGFCLYTHGTVQFAAYYDAERRMTVAARNLDETVWRTAILPETLGWDSHNYVTLAVDDGGFIHLSGNMHAVPLVYYRTAKPLDITTFERAPMIGSREERCTYPKFVRAPGIGLVFTYRDGRSGDGDQIMNVYDTASKTWRRLSDTPLTSGGGQMNAYLSTPTLGPDGRFHVCGVWRDTPDCATNHDVSYARSADLVRWENAAGQPVPLPMTSATMDIVDPVPPGGGVINGGVALGFDSEKRPLIAYHKYDEQGNSQAHIARFQDGAWKKQQLSRWDYRWAFSGGGAIPFEINLSAPAPAGPGKLKVSYHHATQGAGEFIIDEATLAVVGATVKKAKPADAATPAEDGLPGMKQQRAGDSGTPPAGGPRYSLRWETLGANRDKPRPGPAPAPSMLRLVVSGRGE